MRFRILPLLVAMALPLAVPAQAKHRGRDVEKFETSKLPASPTSAIEKELFEALRLHKKGDLSDATRIHAKLGQYYKERGEKELSDKCNTMAMQAWSAATGERPASAGTPFSPPFEPVGTFARSFTYTDELKVEHTWEFYEDGTFAHMVIPAGEENGPRELGFYTLDGGTMRLWQGKPKVDRRVSFQLLGEGGKDGAVLDGVKMVPVG